MYHCLVRFGKDDVYANTSTWIAEFLRMCSHKTTYTTVAISPSPRMFGLQNNNVKFCSSTTTGSQIAYKIGSALWQQRRQRRRRLIKSVTKKIINILQNGIWAKLFITLLCLASHLQADHIILCPVIKWAAYAAKHTLPLPPTHPPLDYYYYNNFAYHPHIVFAYHHHPNDKFFGWSWLLLLVQVLVFISRKPCYLISAPNCVTY